MTIGEVPIPVSSIPNRKYPFICVCVCTHICLYMYTDKAVWDVFPASDMRECKTLSEYKFMKSPQVVLIMNWQINVRRRFDNYTREIGSIELPYNWCKESYILNKALHATRNLFLNFAYTSNGLESCYSKASEILSLLHITCNALNYMGVL